MNDLVKCTRCNNVMMNEEYENHRCIPLIKDCKTIKFASHYIIKDENDRTIIGIRTLDGISYEFIEVPENKEHTKISYQTPNLNRKKFDDKTPTSDQKLIDTSVFVNQDIINSKIYLEII